MNDYNSKPDAPALIALIAFVSLWGLLTCSAALQLAVLRY
jgi:hypothetical protein